SMPPSSSGSAPASSPPPASSSSSGETLREHRDRAEREYILSTLRACEWNISKAATLLGVERTNLHKKMRALGLRRE
ncbi:MAG TPA: helix-turn-helix domain-containing protein, partial [Polyangiaceae bacterium]|nr:helix-turn-helix domain-containing protein [Polyangiaceae bacterium]